MSPTAERGLSALSYANILFLVPLFLGRQSRLAQFHSRQGVVMFVVQTIGGLVAWFPLVGWLFGLLVIAFSFYGALQALMGNEWELPWLGKYAKKLKI